MFTSRKRRLERGDGYPPRPERYDAAGIDLINTLGHRADAVGVHVVREA